MSFDLWLCVKVALTALRQRDPTMSDIEADQFHIQCRKSAWLAAYIEAGLRLDGSDKSRPASILPIEVSFRASSGAHATRA